MKNALIKWAAIIILSFVALIVLIRSNKPLPPVPVHVGSRTGLKGEVAVFNSYYSKTISVVATFNNPTFHQSQSFNLVLQPGQPQEIGWLQGWEVLSGETVSLSSDGWTSISCTFN